MEWSGGEDGGFEDDRDTLPFIFFNSFWSLVGFQFQTVNMTCLFG